MTDHHQSPAEHYREAERLLTEMPPGLPHDDIAMIQRTAQVHATLATAGDALRAEQRDTAPDESTTPTPPTYPRETRAWEAYWAVMDGDTDYVEIPRDGSRADRAQTERVARAIEQRIVDSDGPPHSHVLANAALDALRGGGQ